MSCSEMRKIDIPRSSWNERKGSVEILPMRRFKICNETKRSWEEPLISRELSRTG